jgi:hypothetical protein
MGFVTNLPPPRPEECSDIVNLGGIILPNSPMPDPGSRTSIGNVVSRIELKDSVGDRALRGDLEAAL